MFKLINAIHYSEHDLNLDHDKILQEVVDSRLKPKNSLHKSRPQQDEVDKQHTFYEDTNLYDETYKIMDEAVSKVLFNIFGPNSFQAEEIWGHIIPPNEQTMIHNHDGMITDNEIIPPNTTANKVSIFTNFKSDILSHLSLTNDACKKILYGTTVVPIKPIITNKLPLGKFGINNPFIIKIKSG